LSIKIVIGVFISRTVLYRIAKAIIDILFVSPPVHRM